MATNHDTAERFAEVCAGTADTYLRSGNVFAETRGGIPHLYSYGHHFTTALFLAAGKHGRRRPLFLLNGDRVSHSTGRHQSDARSACVRTAERIGADVLIVPFSAIDAAGIDRATIRPLEVRPDRWTETHVSCPFDLADLESAHRSADLERNHESDAGGRTYVWIDADGRRWSRTLYWRAFTWTSSGREWQEIPQESFPADHVSGNAYLDRSHEVTQAGPGGPWRATIRRHWLGDSLLMATVAGRRRRFVSSFDANEPSQLYFLATLPSWSTAVTVADAIEDLAPRAVHAARARGIDVERQGDIFAIATSLTDADIAALQRARTRRTVLTAGARPKRGEIGYVDPAARRRRIAERYRAIRSQGWSTPRPTRGQRVARHDPAPPAYLVDRAAAELTNELAQRTARRRENRAAMRAMYDPAPLAAHLAWRHARTMAGPDRWNGELEWTDEIRSRVAELYRSTRARGTYGRPHPQVRRTRREATYMRLVRTYAARDLARVQLEHANNRAKLRPSGPETAERALWRARMDTDSIDRAAVAAALSFHGTQHTATEVVRGPGGTIYARGLMYHEPTIERATRGGFRDTADHVRRPLGDRKTWYLILRNTVPRARA